MKKFILVVLIAIAILISSPFKFLVVHGSSMEPTIKEGDLIVVYQTNELKIGDVITYLHEVDGRHYLFTHRIVEMHGDIIRTKGDALEKPDSYTVKKSDVVGKVVLVIPMLGMLILLATSTAGWISFILIPSILLIAIEVRRIWRLRNE